MKSRVQSGFTILEALVVVAIIGILTAVALPGYKQYIIRGNRSTAEAFMLNLANKQEQYLLDKRKYFCTTGGGCANEVTIDSISNVPAEVSRNYTITATASDTATPPTFTITATRVTGSSQAADSKCGNLTYTSAQVKGISGGTGAVSDCW